LQIMDYPATRRPRRDIKPDRIRALELLASCDSGCPEGILHAHGFAKSDMVELVRSGLATATAERMIAGSRKMEVARVRGSRAASTGKGSAMSRIGNEPATRTAASMRVPAFQLCSRCNLRLARHREKDVQLCCDLKTAKALEPPRTRLLFAPC
jgi:hypothetical protein